MTSVDRGVDAGRDDRIGDRRAVADDDHLPLQIGQKEIAGQGEGGVEIGASARLGDRRQPFAQGDERGVVGRGQGHGAGAHQDDGGHVSLAQRGQPRQRLAPRRLPAGGSGLVAGPVVALMLVEPSSRRMR